MSAFNSPENALDGARPIRDGVPASRVQLPRGVRGTLHQAMCACFPRIGAAVWSERFARGCVLDASGRALAADATAVVGMEVYYFREVAQEPVIPFNEAVLHADAHLVVADKPHFLPVAPTGRWVRETLLARLQQRLGNPDLVPLHRIDRDTAGLVLFSADARSRGAYQALFRERRIDKQYLALAPPLPGLVFPYLHRSRLERGEPFHRMREVAGEPNSETRIEVIGRGEQAWLYRLHPITGRKHQLRVHMAALGAPITGDPLYPQLRGPSADDHARPLQLFAHSLAFVDPLTGQQRHYSRGDVPAALPQPAT